MLIGIGAAAGAPARDVLRLAVEVERLGLDALWIHDLPFTAERPPAAYEPLVMLSALAQVTSRIVLGVTDLVIPFRHPLMIAKMLATTDQLAGGRIVLGASIGDSADAFAAAGVSGLFAEREAVTDDYLRAVKEAWLNTGPSRYTGDFVRFADVGTFPHPVRQPHVPIWALDSGSHWLRRAVRLGSGFISRAQDLEAFQRQRRDMVRFAERDRRDPSEITAALIVTLGAKRAGGATAVPLLDTRPDAIVGGLARLEQAGVDLLLVEVDAAGEGLAVATLLGSARAAAGARRG